MTDKKRYIIVMIISVLLNLILYNVALSLNLPLWLDSTGTILSAVMLEPSAGLIVGLIDNFLLAIEDVDPSSLIYYAVSAATAIIAGVNMRKKGKSLAFRISTSILYIIVTTTILSALLTIWRTDGTGVPDNFWEGFFYAKAVAVGVPQIVACFFGTFVIKLFDTLAMAGLVAVMYIAFPKSMKKPLLYAEVQGQ